MSDQVSLHPMFIFVEVAMLRREAGLKADEVRTELEEVSNIREMNALMNK